MTFFADTPVWWNVLSVICVTGSPIDCAARTPIASPGATIAVMKRLRISPITQARPLFERRSFPKQQRFAESFERSKMKKSMVALYCALTESGSLPLTTTRSSCSASMRRTTSTGLTSVGVPCARGKRICASHTRRAMFTGIGAFADIRFCGSRHWNMSRSSWRSALSVASSRASTSLDSAMFAPRSARIVSSVRSSPSRPLRPNNSFSTSSLYLWGRSGRRRESA